MQRPGKLGKLRNDNLIAETMIFATEQRELEKLVLMAQASHKHHNIAVKLRKLTKCIYVRSLLAFDDQVLRYGMKQNALANADWRFKVTEQAEADLFNQLRPHNKLFFDKVVLMNPNKYRINLSNVKARKVDMHLVRSHFLYHFDHSVKSVIDSLSSNVEQLHVFVRNPVSDSPYY